MDGFNRFKKCSRVSQSAAWHHASRAGSSFLRCSLSLTMMLSPCSEDNEARCLTYHTTAYFVITINLKLEPAYLLLPALTSHARLGVAIILSETAQLLDYNRHREHTRHPRIKRTGTGTLYLFEQTPKT
jgi:hypothetical protein